MYFLFYFLIFEYFLFLYYPYICFTKIKKIKKCIIQNIKDLENQS
jgi:hypothetical protein